MKTIETNTDVGQSFVETALLRFSPLFVGKGELQDRRGAHDPSIMVCASAYADVGG